MPGTILFGIDVESASPDSAGFVERASALFTDLGTPVTWYVTGKTLEMYPDLFREADRSPLIELQSHTYSHVLLKTVLLEPPPGMIIHGATDFFMQRGGTADEVDKDLERAQAVFRQVLGRPATALCGPWGYYRGLADRPDLLEIVDRHGFTILRTFGRNERDGQPVPLEWQPRFLRVQGYPRTLEVLIHDYQDDFYWREYGSPGGDYVRHLQGIADRVAAADLVWSLCSHDHHCATAERFARKGAWFRAIIEYAQGLGMRFLTVSDYYRERLQAQEGH